LGEAAVRLPIITGNRVAGHHRSLVDHWRGNGFVTFGMYVVTGNVGRAHHRAITGVQKVYDQEARHRKSAAALRDVARVLLDRADKVDSLDQKRNLARQAFELVQEAVALQPLRDEREHPSVKRTPLRGL
jgi:hypothetical protein